MCSTLSILCNAAFCSALETSFMGILNTEERDFVSSTFDTLGLVFNAIEEYPSELSSSKF